MADFIQTINKGKADRDFLVYGTDANPVLTVDAGDNLLKILNGASLGLGAAKGRLVFTDDTADTIAVTGADLLIDTDRYIGLGAAKGRLVFTDAATDTIAIMNANFGIGTNTPTYPLTVSALSGYTTTSFRCYSTTLGHTALLGFLKSHSATEALATTLNNEVIGSIYFTGVNGAGTPAVTDMGLITVMQSGDAGATYNAADMVFQVSTNAGALAEKMRIASTGLVTIANNLTVNGLLTLNAGASFESIFGAAVGSYGEIDSLDISQGETLIATLNTTLISFQNTTKLEIKHTNSILQMEEGVVTYFNGTWLLSDSNGEAGVVYPLNVAGYDAYDLAVGDGVGIKLSVPNNGSYALGASIEALRESATDNDSSTTLKLRVAPNGGTVADCLTITSTKLVTIYNSLTIDKTAAAAEIAMTRVAVGDGQNLAIYAGGGELGGEVGNRSGGSLILRPGISTGTGKSLAIIQRASRASASGTADNAFSNAMAFPTRVHSLAGGATLFNLNLADGQHAGGHIDYVMHFSDGTDHQVRTGSVVFSCVRKGAAYTEGYADSTDAVESKSAGTITPGWSISSGVVLCSGVSSLTETVSYIEYVLHVSTDSAVTFY